MRDRLRKADIGADVIVRWAGLYVIVTGGFTWLNQHVSWFAELGWAERLFVAICMGLGAVFLMAASLALWRYFHPLKPIAAAPTVAGDVIEVPAPEAAPPPPPSRQIKLTTTEKEQAKEILVSLADLIRDSWWPLLNNARWLSSAQDVYAQNLPTLPALADQALQVTIELHGFVNAHEHMLAIMGLSLSDFGKAAAGIHEPIRHYIDRADVLGGGLSDHVIMLLQADAEPVRDAFGVYNVTLSHLQRTVTMMRKEIDG